jgi:uncharacterized membrane protein YozB (DUF420 family)
MATEHAHAGVHFDHNENIDHQGNANFAIWLGLVSLTFMTATFVASNVYLREWSPSKFHLSTAPLLRDLPNVSVLLSIVSALLLLGAGVAFVKNRWVAFNALLGVSVLSYAAELIVQFNLMVWFTGASQQMATIYAPTAVIQFLLTFVCVILLAVAGWYASFPNKAKINSFFPAAMNVWLYAAASSIVILLMEDVISFGQFAAWCGQHLTGA